MEYLFIYCLQLFENLTEIGFLAMFFGILGGITGLIFYIFLENDRQYASEYEGRTNSRPFDQEH